MEGDRGGNRNNPGDRDGRALEHDVMGLRCFDTVASRVWKSGTVKGKG